MHAVPQIGGVVQRECEMANRLLKYTLLVVGGVQGLFMVIDGLHVIRTGSYIGGQVGPWAVIVRAVGLNVYSMGPFFLALGSLWLVGCVLLLVRPSKGLILLTGAASISLLYALFGTVLSVIALAIVLAHRRTLRKMQAETSSAPRTQAT